MGSAASCHKTETSDFLQTEIQWPIICKLQSDLESVNLLPPPCPFCKPAALAIVTMSSACNGWLLCGAKSGVLVAAVHRQGVGWSLCFLLLHRHYQYNTSNYQ